MPYYSNEEIRTRPAGYVPASVDDRGHVTSPKCCGQEMDDAGGCSSGCCDDYRCGVCGYEVRIEWPD